MISSRFLRLLVAAAVVLPVALAVMWGVGNLLEAMQDRVGSVWVSCAAGVVGLLWVLDLILLLMALGINAVGPDDNNSDNDHHSDTTTD